VTVYHLAVGLGTYIADGLVAHNKNLPYAIYPFCFGCELPW
jgi:hypothetical protein